MTRFEDWMFWVVCWVLLVIVGGLMSGKPSRR